MPGVGLYHSWWCTRRAGAFAKWVGGGLRRGAQPPLLYILGLALLLGFLGVR